VPFSVQPEAIRDFAMAHPKPSPERIVQISNNIIARGSIRKKTHGH
jgi:hypothetical protein